MISLLILRFNDCDYIMALLNYNIREIEVEMRNSSTPKR